MPSVFSTRAAARVSSKPSTASARGALPVERAAARATTAPKAPRRDLARLAIVADLCPQIFLRTLGLIAQRDIVPLTMVFERTPRRLRFEIEVEGLSDHQAAVLAAKVGELVRVRSARWVRPRRR